MRKPTKENIATVMSGLEEFFIHMTRTQRFNLQEFVSFMEPRFLSADYRNASNRHNDSSGGVC